MYFTTGFTRGGGSGRLASLAEMKVKMSVMRSERGTKKAQVKRTSRRFWAVRASIQYCSYIEWIGEKYVIQSSMKRSPSWMSKSFIKSFGTFFCGPRLL